MKKLILLLIIVSSSSIFAQESYFSSIEFVTVLNENTAEALFYYQNNWQVLRNEAIKKEYIDSYQLLETEASDDAPFSFILITTYANKKQYEAREDHFQELIKAQNGLKLLNDKKPVDFRKSLYGKDFVKHWN